MDEKWQPGMVKHEVLWQRTGPDGFVKWGVKLARNMDSC